MKQLRFLIFIGVFAMLTPSEVWSKPLHIHVKMEGLNYDTIWLGTTYGRKPMATASYALKNQDGSFDFNLKEGLAPGFYAIIYKPAPMTRFFYFHLAIDADQGDFEVSCSMSDVFGTLQFKNNQESSLYYEYRNVVSVLITDYIKMIDYYRYHINEESYQFITAKEEQIVIHQAKFLANHPVGLTADLVRLTPMMAAPRSGDWEKDRMLRWQLFTQQYLKNWQPNNALFWSSPMGIDWLDHYVLTLWDEKAGDPSGPVFEAMTLLKPYAEPFNYYLSYLLQLIPRSSRFDLDQIYVYLVRKYVEPTDKTLFGEEEWYRHTNQANGINRLMTGNYLPDLRFYDENNAERRLYDLESPYTLIVFWNPDCPHCKKELPALSKIFPTYKAMGLKVVTICGKRGEQVGACWQGVKEMQLPSAWYFWADPEGLSRFQLIYNVATIPSMYLLNENHRILFRVRGDLYDEELAWLLKKHIKAK